MFHCLFIVLKIPLFFMPSSHDPVIRLFHCLFIVLKIPLFSMPSSIPNSDLAYQFSISFPTERGRKLDPELNFSRSIISPYRTHLYMKSWTKYAHLGTF
jgi:hypothetical protein